MTMDSLPEFVLTVSGREIPPPPEIKLTSGAAAARGVHAVHRWLAEQALEEARARDAGHLVPMFEGDLRTLERELPQASLDAMNLFLFGHENPRLELHRRESATEPTLRRSRP